MAGRRFSASLRRWLRALHRDFGYFVVGLTLVYAISGLAVNHLEDWDPNFDNVDRTLKIDKAAFKAALARGPGELGKAAMEATGHSGGWEDLYEVDESHIDISLEETNLYVDLDAGEIREEGQEARPVLRLINWLHLNRGKRAWTWFADAYALILLYLAVSGLFMLKSKRFLLNRKTLLVSAGIAVPLLYIGLSGGP